MYVTWSCHTHLATPTSLVCLLYRAVCFNIYDLKSAGYILREEMFHLLKSTMVKVLDTHGYILLCCVLLQVNYVWCF